MFQKILVPVDLAHTETLAKALQVAADLALASGGTVVYAAITASQPNEVAPNPDAFAAKLDSFVADQKAEHKIEAEAMPLLSNDPEREIADGVLEAAAQAGADLVVMASHIPGWFEHIFHSNAGYVACHSPISVFVVR